MQQLCNEVATKTNQWQSIALNLGIAQTYVDRIAIECEGNIQKCFTKVFDQWCRDARRPFNWETMICVLQEESVAEYYLAVQLEEKYCV